MQSVNEVTDNIIYACDGEVIVVFRRNEDTVSERCLSNYSNLVFQFTAIEKKYLICAQ
jgi:hypothetical protein